MSAQLSVGGVPPVPGWMPLSLLRGVGPICLSGRALASLQFLCCSISVFFLYATLPDSVCCRHFCQSWGAQLACGALQVKRHQARWHAQDLGTTRVTSRWAWHLSAGYSWWGYQAGTPLCTHQWGVASCQVSILSLIMSQVAEKHAIFPTWMLSIVNPYFKLS